MTPDKSEIRKLTLSSHPGKAIIRKKDDSLMMLGDAKDAFKIFITDEGIMFSEEVPVHCLDGEGFKEGSPLRCRMQEPGKGS